MDIKNVLSIVLTNYNDNNMISNKVLKEIQDSVKEMQIAEDMFNNVDDPKLIEAAIYRQEAAKKRFDYLLSIAKEQFSKQKTETKEEMEI